MDKTLKITLTEDRHKRPLAVIANLPGEGAELYPHQLRILALALLKVADDCEAHQPHAKHYLAAQREYMLF